MRSCSPNNQATTALSAFDIHDDALYQEVNNARRRLAQCLVSLSSVTTSATQDPDAATEASMASFSEIWESEFSRLTMLLEQQQSNLEFTAKSLLMNVESATQRLTQNHGNSSNDNVDDEVSTSMDSTFEASRQIKEWRAKADALVQQCLTLQHFAIHNRSTLQQVATYADLQLQTSNYTTSWKRRSTVAPWKTGPNSSLVVVLSDIYQVLRLAEENLSEPRSSSGDDRWVAPGSFMRKTVKYWVEDDQLTELLLAAVKEAPLLVYGKSGRLTSKQDCLSLSPSSRHPASKDKLWEELATPITSVYLDSPDMRLYKERLPRREGAQLLRVRWYGRMPRGNEIVFLELKTHHEKWVNTKSVKERVALREKDVPKFLRPTESSWSREQAQEVLLAATPTLVDVTLERDVDKLLRMHQLKTKHKLQPCVRTCYLRAAFQSPRSNSLRLTVDRNVTIIDENRSASKYADSWCLPEDSIIASDMAHRLPFVILEVKIAGDDPNPAIIQSLEAKGIIQEARKFSKFLTGAASFNLDRIGTLPYWAEHPAFAGVFGIGTPPTRTIGVETSHRRPSEAVSDTITDTKYESDETSETSRASAEKEASLFSRKHTDPAVNVGTLPIREELEANAPPGRRLSVRGLLSFKSSAQSRVDIDEGKKKTPTVAAGNFFRRRFGRKHSEYLNGDDTIEVAKIGTSLKVAPKRPARVEPKSYFANERTFIQWISAALLLVTISVILLGIDSNMGTTSEYARKAGIGVCCGAVMIVCYATFTYFRRLQLLSTGRPYGYIDHVGPFILACSVCVGVVVLLTHFLGEIEFARLQSQKTVYLHEEPGKCYMHSNRGISKLEYQPSDIAVDPKHNALLVPSLQRIVSHSMEAPIPNRENRVQTLIEIPNSNIEGLTIIDDRVFALSEGQKGTELIELFWNADSELEVSHRWKLSNSQEAEGITYVPDKTRRSGRLFVDVNRQIQIYELPEAAHVTTTANQDNDENDDSLIIADTDESVELDRIGSLNNHVLTTGLEELKISSMFYFEGVTYILHDNEMLLRAWDIDEGDLLAEIPLPRVEGGFSKEWEGIALERRLITESGPHSLLTQRNYQLRGSSEAGETQLILHLALDTPAQVWSIVVKQGGQRGSLLLPSCAVSAHAKADSVSEDESSDSLDKQNRL